MCRVHGSMWNYRGQDPCGGGEVLIRFRINEGFNGISMCYMKCWTQYKHGTWC